MGQELGTELARYVIEAVIRQGRSCREVAAAHGVSKSWVAKVVARYRAGGAEAIGPRSRAAVRIPNRTPVELEDAIVALRKRLTEDGFDAGAVTIQSYLQRDGGPAPSTTTIWRVLRRRGFVIPQPHKRPRSSWKRFEATLPNECWQSDATHWRLADDTGVEIVNVIDDHSRVCIASSAVPVTTAAALVDIFQIAAKTWGFPASCSLTTVTLTRPGIAAVLTRSSASCSHEGSCSRTRGPTILKPAARSNVSIRPSSCS